MPDRSLIYILDGNPRCCESLAAVLGADGCSASICNSTQAFRAQSRTDKPACVFLDLWLSDTTGLTFPATVFFKLLGLPVIATGALPHLSDVIQAFRLGVVEFLTKPFETRQLMARLADGVPIKAIAKELKISIRTFHNRRTALLNRLGVRTRAELIQIQTQLKQISFDDGAGPESFSETPELSLFCFEEVRDAAAGLGD